MRHGIRGHGDEFVAFALVEDVQAVLGRSGTDREGAGGGLAFECVDQVGDNGLAVVVEGLAGSELLDEGEVPRRASGDDFVAGCDGELDGITTNARRSSPDEKGLAGRFWGCGGILEAQLVFLE